MLVLAVECGDHYLFVFFDHIASIYLFDTIDWRTHNFVAIHYNKWVSMFQIIRAQRFALTSGFSRRATPRWGYTVNRGVDPGSTYRCW